MKRIVYIIVFALLAFVPAATTFAFNDIRQGKPKEKPTKSSEVNEKELEGTCEVSFRIDGTGKVEILSINATSPQLADYVIRKLNKIQLEKGDPQIGQIIKYRFVFKKQA